MVGAVWKEAVLQGQNEISKVVMNVPGSVLAPLLGQR